MTHQIMSVIAFLWSNQAFLVLKRLTMYHYIHLKISPPSLDVLNLRKIIANALSQMFGLLAEGTYLDILSLAEDGTECILRVRSECV